MSTKYLRCIKASVFWNYPVYKDAVYMCAGADFSKDNDALYAIYNGVHSSGYGFPVADFKEWTPQINDYVLDRGKFPARITGRGVNDSGTPAFRIDYEDAEGWNWELPQRIVPVLNRAPYCEGDKKEFKSTAQLNEMRLQCECGAEMWDQFQRCVQCGCKLDYDAHVVTTPQDTKPVVESKTESALHKVPLGSTPTAEKMRLEFEARIEDERRRAEQRATMLKQMAKLEVKIAIEEPKRRYITIEETKQYRVLTGGDL